MSSDRSKDDTRRAAMGQSPDGKEASNSNATNQPSSPQINTTVAVSENVTMSPLARTASLSGQASNSAAPSAGMTPPEALLPITTQPTSLSRLLQASQAPLNVPMPSELSLNCTPPLSSLAGLPHMLQQAQTPSTPTYLQGQGSFLNQLSSAQLSLLSLLAGAPHALHQAQAQISSLDASLPNQPSSAPPLLSLAGLPNMPQVPCPPPSLQASLVGQLLQLTSLAHTNVAGLPRVYQAPTAPSPQAQSLQQLASIQTNQRSYLPPSQSTSDSANAYLFHRLSASQNPSVPPIAPQDQSQLLQLLLQENMVKDQRIASLLSQQQTQPAEPNNNRTAAQMGAPTDSLELLLQRNAAHPASNSEHTSQGISLFTALINSLPQQSSQNAISSAPYHSILNVNSEQPTTKASTSNFAASEHPNPPNQSKDKRWIVRYEELNQFRQNYGHCRVPHGYSENRKLAWWVMNQRAQYQLLKQGKKSWLSEDRVALLDAIGFDWSPMIANSLSR